jgi:hypothetical protein
VAHADVIESRAEFIDVSQVTNPNYLVTQDAVVSSPQIGVNGPEFRVNFTAERSRIKQNFALPVSWADKDISTWCVQNLENRTVNLIIMIQTRADPNDYTGSLAYQMVLPPNQTVRYAIVFRETDPRQFGVKYFPQAFDKPITRIYNSPTFERGNIYSWRFVLLDTQPANVVISDFSLLNVRRTMDGIADQFFQYDFRDWPGKTHSVGDMIDAKADESADLDAHPAPSTLDGSNTLPNQGAATRWRVKTINGKKYLVSPAGKPFWSFGMQGIHDITSTWIDGRTSMFQYLPDRNGPDGDLYGTITRAQGQGGGTVTSFECVKYNLRQKYGVNYFNEWMALNKRRLRSWGMNTVGPWCDDAMYDNTMPYTFFLDTYDFPTRLDVPALAWMKLPDPYASNFEGWMADKFGRLLRNHNGRSNFMGVYVDNEQSWGHIMDGTYQSRYAVALGALKAPANQPAKVALVAMLTSKYTTISRLNRAWGTNFSTWGTVRGVVNLNPANFNNALVADLRLFTQRLASTYFSKVKRALNASGCTALYFGCRFWYYTPEVVTAASQNVDVLSFNNYAQPDQFPWAYVASLQKPVIISEWSDPINANGSIGWNAQSPTESRQVIVDMVSQALRNPNIVGMHWYELYDMPVTGHAAHYWNIGFGALDI